MNTRKTIIQKVTAMLLVFMLTIANFAVVGGKVIAAVQAVATSNKSVEISAYFENEQGEKVETIEAPIDQTDLKLKVDVTVNNDDGLGGYFDGTINVGDANFKIKDDDEISIHVNAGNTETIEKEVEYLETDNLTAEYLSKESKIVINGTYINSKDEYEITGETKVCVNWKTPAGAQAGINAQVLTNKDYKVVDGEEEKTERVVQLLVRSKISNNAYPVRSTVIRLDVPEGAEEVKVHKRTTDATNGDQELSEENYAYENGVLTITLENTGDEINWKRNAQDILVVTYKYPEGTDLKGTQINLNNTITTYDGTELTAETTTNIEEEVDGIVTSSIVAGETEIYKGKIYSGEERIYNTTTQINIDDAEATDKIEVEEAKAVYVVKTEEDKEEEKEANITYVKTEINKDNFQRIFGEEGYITIKDQEGNVVANISKDSETDENGNIVINYNNVTALQIETSKPITEGILRLNHEKKIGASEYTREEIGRLTGIKEGNETVTLKETETKANLNVETTSLSTTEEGQELKLRVTLETDNESKDLYKNPEIKITLPKQIKVTGARYKMLYGNGLETNGATITTENGQSVITINLNGEQKSYEGDAVNGTIIDVVANVDVDRLATTSTEKIKLEYTNENRTDFVGQENKQIDIVAESTMILTNNAEKAGIETLGSDETRDVNLEIGAKATDETINMQIINNEEDKITDIAVLGKLPTNGENIKLASAVKTNVDAEVYYTDVEDPTADLNDTNNGWSNTQTANSANYLVLVDSLEDAQSLELTYNLSIKENLGYNIEEEANYNVTYTNSKTGIEQTVKSSTLLLTTGASAELETKLTASVGSDKLSNGDEVRAGEIIKYELEVKNNGKEDATGVNITGNIPEGTTLVKVNKDYWNSETSDKESGIEEDGDPNAFISESEGTSATEVNTDDVTTLATSGDGYYVEQPDATNYQENATIPAGSTRTFSYMVRVNSDVADNTQATAEISAQYGEANSKQTITHTFRSGNIHVELLTANRSEDEEVSAGYVYQYELEVTNISDSEQKNIQLTINNNELLTVTRVTDFTDGLTDLGATQTITIDSLAAGETAYIEINALVNQPTNDLKRTQISVTATDSNNNSYRSNAVSEPVTGMSVNVNLTSETTSSNQTGYVYEGDTITYTITVKNTGKTDADSLVINDMISDYVTIENVTLNGEKVEYDTSNVFSTETEEVDYSIIEIDAPLKAGESATVVITVTVNETVSSETLIVRNKATIYNDTKLAETDEITYYIEATTAGDGSQGGQGSGSGSGNTGGSGTGTGSEETGYSISGTVWVDENGDGSRETGENVLEGITVYAIDVETNDIKATATTNNEGLYTLSGLEDGNYIVAFEYDTVAYIVTSYQTDGVDSSRNSDALKSSMMINGERKEVAATDSLAVNSSIANIDLGLIENKVFDLDIEKFVSSVTVTNSTGTKTYDQEDGTTLAQVQIGSKVLSGTNVVVEYKIRVTNNGEIAGYARTIVDYLPSALSFSSSLNSDWYQSGEYIYNSSLANTKIEPGESKELTLVVTKTMTNSNTGLINNQVAIDDSYNTLGINDSDKEDNGSADIIIGIKTGAAVSYVILTFTIIIVICGVAYLVNKKILKNKIEI